MRGRLLDQGPVRHGERVRARMPQEAHDHLQGCHWTEVRMRLILASGKREEGSYAPDSPQGHKASQMSGKYSPKSLLGESGRCLAALSII